MKEFLWYWFFSMTFAFTLLLACSLLLAYALFSAAPYHPHTPFFAIGFGFCFGFLGLGSLTFLFYDRLTKKIAIISEEEGELVKKVVKEAPFFFFSLIFFFSLAAFISLFMFMIPFIKDACG
ncbi:MAG: hypothetical protein HQM08_06120 [Candidatus Riflebacteria bacterium]|nr:hypothetical protein [Candidatus Riflebacteria bacterium]